MTDPYLGFGKHHKIFAKTLQTKILQTICDISLNSTYNIGSIAIILGYLPQI